MKQTIRNTGKARLSLHMLLALVTFWSCSHGPSDTDTEDRWTISPSGVGMIEIGAPIAPVVAALEAVATVEPHDNGTLGFDLVEDGEVLVKVSELDGRVGVVEVYSDLYAARSGLRVGTTIAALRDLYLDFTPEMDPHNGRVYFTPNDLQSDLSRCNVYFVSKDDGPVWGFTKTPNGSHFTYAPQGDIDDLAVVEVIVMAEHP